MSFPKTGLNKVKRLPKRGFYDRETIYEILKEPVILNVGFSLDDQPFIIPMGYGRIGDIIYLHTSIASRLAKFLKKNPDEEVKACLSATITDGIVIARSLFHHSLNYRSVCLFGSLRLVTDEDEWNEGLKAIVEQMVPGRWDDSREPNATEIKSTAVLALEIESGSAKIRTGPPGDDKKDIENENNTWWAGVINLEHNNVTSIEVDQGCENLDIPENIQNYSRNLD
eukprot:TRINITY_DN1515_c0_g1_i1.p1 TRINITY_DN1515_c0_g1~~TRINITY_DN1515_c0_g1_i1.p1  ORF type:complete len:254 (+),score=79.04 TRINITY_DN1515_c0_g1_i1:86-763(+)